MALTPTLGTGIVWLVAIALTAWVAAGWYWRIKSPSAPSLPTAVSTDPAGVARSLSSRHFFGEIVQEAAPVIASRYTLVGVSANLADGGGFAIVKIDDQTAMPFVVGEEIQPGVVFVRALPDAIELKRGTTVERVALTESNAGSNTPAPIGGMMPGQTFQPAPGINSPPQPVQPQVQTAPQQVNLRPPQQGQAPAGYTPRGFNTGNSVPMRQMQSPGAGVQSYQGNNMNASAPGSQPPPPEAMQSSPANQ
ncbi:type II secretion system protein N [Niveibacterium sp. SC-1]|uniref:type II secretion system protein N n=1 Tax=Niveibacterium sp. SC-1 TaxID=3135646 RepID=UPI00311FD535